MSIVKVPYKRVLLSIITCHHLLLTYHTQTYFMKAFYYFKNMALRNLTLLIISKSVLCSIWPFGNLGIGIGIGIFSEKRPSPRRFTCEYIRTFSTSTGRPYMSSAFLKKLRIVSYRAALFIKTLFHRRFFRQNILFKRASFQHIFQK